MVLVVMIPAFLLERGSRGIERPETPRQLRLAAAELSLKPGSEGLGIGRLLGAEAGVAATVVARTEGSASGMCDRTHARCSLGDENANLARQLALYTDAVSRDNGPAAGQIGAQHFQQLQLVRRTALQLKVDRYVS